MSCVEAENISKYLKSKEIQLPSNNKWLLECINWYKTHVELRNIYNTLQDYVCIQWLLSDLRDVQYHCLPTNCKDGTVQLTSKYCVQINWLRDISQPCYTQLQAMKNSNIAESNDNISTEETKKQNWEPNPKRVLMMEITDGCTTLKAIEYSPIPKLIEPFIPGCKVVLIGPIECRKGILLLRTNNINLLGGEVDHLNEVYAKETMLSRCLNIIPPDNGSSGRITNGPVTGTHQPAPTTGTRRPQQLFNDVDQLPDSTSVIESNPYEDNRDIVMSEDDDDVFYQLPDTVFNGADNFDQQPNQSFSVLNNELIENDVQSSTFLNVGAKSPVLNSVPKNINKPKLFPSVEDLRPLGKEPSPPSNLNKSISFSLAKNIPTTANLPETSYPTRLTNTTKPELCTNITVAPKNKPSSEKQNENIGSIHSLNNTVVEQRFAEANFETEMDQNYEESRTDHSDGQLNVSNNEAVYPQFKRLRVKVDNITKLKIRNGEWNCCASVSVEGKTDTVTFCNKVLETLFGISASKVEVWRGEMATNQSLKKKVNDILKAGQTKLKFLNCLMTVEYASEDCTPNIVSVHEH